MVLNLDTTVARFARGGVPPAAFGARGVDGAGEEAPGHNVTGCTARGSGVTLEPLTVVNVPG
jgi:hypothetical protein